jgi:hypothetical protein
MENLKHKQSTPFTVAILLHEQKQELYSNIDELSKINK